MAIPEEFREPEWLSAADLEASLGRCGKDLKIFKGCRIFPPNVVEIGDRSQVDESVKIFGGKRTSIGRNVHLAFGSSISGGGECDIGDYVSIGAGVRIITGTDLPGDGKLNNPTIGSELRSVDRDKVKIGSLAIVYTASIVFPGVTIGEGAVVGAGSLVHRDLKPWVIYAGNPLVAIGKRDPEMVLRAAEEYASK